MFAALEPLTEADMARTTMIRGEAHSVMQAINRQIGHYACHCGQIVLLAKHCNAERWESLSVPRGNRRSSTGACVREKRASDRAGDLRPG